MSYPINYKNIKKDIEFYNELNAVQQKAVDYLVSFKWCKEVKNCFLYINLGEVFCIFLFEIVNAQSVEDSLLWVIVGDIPSMYLDTHGFQTTLKVIEGYIDLAKNWIRNVREGKSLKDSYPFNAAPTLELAGLLEKRIAFMENTLINNIDDLSYQLSK